MPQNRMDKALSIFLISCVNKLSFAAERMVLENQGETLTFPPFPLPFLVFLTWSCCCLVELMSSALIFDK